MKKPICFVTTYTYFSSTYLIIVNPNLGELFRCSFWGGGGGGGGLKLVKITLEIWNLVSKYTHM